MADWVAIDRAQQAAGPAGGITTEQAGTPAQYGFQDPNDEMIKRLLWSILGATGVPEQKEKKKKKPEQQPTQQVTPTNPLWEADILIDS